MKILWIILITSLIVLSGCQQEQTLEPNGDTVTAVPPAKPTCTLDNLEANPAGYKRSGSMGGVGLKGNPTMKPSDLATVGAVAEEMATVFPVTGIANDVVLIVADDYGKVHTDGGTSVYKLHPSVFSLAYKNFTPDNLANELHATLDALLAEGKLSHGAFILTYLLDIFRSLGATLMSMTDTEITLRLNETNIIVRAVEVSGLDTQGIRNALAFTRNFYRGKGIEHFVVNMSFTLEPCQDIDKFRQSQETSFDSFLKATPPAIGPGDPLYDFIEDSRDTVFVAAAGNNNLTQPRQPGLMPSVVSVSASLGATGSIADFSNDAEVMMAGVWLPLRDAYNRNGYGKTSPEMLLGGTSFAAPAVSAASVLDMASAPIRCFAGAGGSLLAHGAYTNLSLEFTVNTFCN